MNDDGILKQFADNLIRDKVFKSEEDMIDKILCSLKRGIGLRSAAYGSQMKDEFEKDADLLEALTIEYLLLRRTRSIN